jgi:hypothetical protein
MKRIAIFLFVFFVIISCNKEYPKNVVEYPEGGKEYPFVFMDTTGICTYLLINNNLVAIEYSERSDQENLQLFHALKWTLLYPNAQRDDIRIFVVGKLHDELLSTIECEGCPEPEKYQEFELYTWYIETPFSEIQYDEKNPMDVDFYKTIERRHLAAIDFRIDKLKYNIDDYDLQKYER